MGQSVAESRNWNMYSGFLSPGKNQLLKSLAISSTSKRFLVGSLKMFSTKVGNRQIAGFSSTSKFGTGEAVVTIMLVTFIAHFVFFPFFGIYDDDYILTLPTMGWSWHDFANALSGAWIHPVFARPLNFFLRGIIFFFTVHNGHLAAGFLLSWLLVSANAILLYTLIRRILPHAPALIGSLVFVLFPLDTSRQILMIQTDLLVAIFLLLVCFHLYFAGRYLAAYALVMISLLNLESLFPPFLAAPILVAGFAGTGSWKNFFKKLFTHAVVLAALFGFFVLGRLALGESRAREVSLKAGDTIGRMVRLGTEGPWHGLEALIQRPLDGALHCGARLLPYVLLTIAATAWALSRRNRQDDIETKVSSASPVREKRRAALYVFVGGLLVWSLSYVLWVPDDYFPPVVNIGRETGMHAAAAIGAGLAAAGLAVWIGSLSFMPKRVLVLAFSCYCGALVAFGVQIQLTEYVTYWGQTKRFWNVLLDQIRDIQDGDVVLVELSSDNRVMPVTKGFGEFDQESYFPMALPYFVDFPAAWEQKPRVYGLWAGCGHDDLSDSIKLHTPIWAPTIWPTIHSGNFIYFRARNGRLERVTDWVTIEGKQLQPKTAPKEDLPPLRFSKIYLNLTSSADSKNWPTLRNARNYPH